MRMIVCLLLAPVLFGQALPRPGFVHEAPFDPRTATGKYKHPASITELDNGDLYLTYYGGDGEYAPSTAVYGSRKGKGSARWSTPAKLAQDPFYSAGNPVVWQAPDGLVWLWYVVRPGATWSTSRIAAKVSRDGARTWSDASFITFEEGTLVQAAPIVPASGEYLLPVWKETGHDTEFVAADAASFFLLYDPKTRKWTESSRVHSRVGNIEPSAAELRPGELVAFCRRAGGYGVGAQGYPAYVVRTESRDGGRTWTPGEETEFPNPNAAVALLKMASGKLLLVFNDSLAERTPLTAVVSGDGGKTFSKKLNLAEGKNDYAYPYLIQSKDGMVHLVYTSQRRSTVNHLTFTEEALEKALAEAK
ncbi:MAG: exo-alpha-sialidase [Acidobacteria bacterium]|nr:exo-alpha-sialidase [Acidobacteriota bacterium]